MKNSSEIPVAVESEQEPELLTARLNAAGAACKPIQVEKDLPPDPMVERADKAARKSKLTFDR